MKRLGPDELLALLEAGAFDELRGCAESPQVEFKAQPYPLSRESAKRELAKDVSAVANGSGGLIILGARTERDPVHPTDVVRDIVPFERNLLHIEQYEAVLASWVYPTPRATVQWFPSQDDPSRGLAAISIEQLPNSQQPALIRRPYEDESGKATGVLVGLFVRAGANARPASIEELHARISQGRLVSDLSHRMSSLEEALAGIQEELGSSARGPGADFFDHEFPARRKRHTQEAELDQQPRILLAAVPGKRVEVPDLFGGSGARTPSLISNPPAVRPEIGFGLFSGSETRIIGAKYRLATSFGRTLALWKDGFALFVASANSDFLCWASDKRGPPDQLVFNQLALVEVVYDFCVLVESIFEQLYDGPITMIVELQGMNPEGRVHVLPAGPLGAWGRAARKQPAPESEFSAGLTLDSPAGAARAAFKLLESIYAWFGLDNDSIPYTAEASGVEVVDPDEIRKGGR